MTKYMILTLFLTTLTSGCIIVTKPTKPVRYDDICPQPSGWVKTTKTVSVCTLPATYQP